MMALQMFKEFIFSLSKVFSVKLGPRDFILSTRISV